MDAPTVLAPAADALGSPEGSALRAAIRDLAPPPRVVVDLARVRQVNSSGLGMLIGALAEARAREGDVRLAHVPERLALLLRLTRLDGTFRQFPSVDDAVASFAD